MRNKLLAALLAVSMVCSATTTAFVAESNGVSVAYAEELQYQAYLTEETVFDGTVNTRYENTDSETLALAGQLESASVTVEFKTTSTALQALAAINGSTNANDYISLYVNNGNRIGFEIRNASTSLNYHQYVDLESGRLSDGEWHVLTFVVEKNVGYSVWLDQQKVLTVSEDTTYFSGSEGWWDIGSVTFGGAKRAVESSSQYLYTGSLKNAKIHASALTATQVKELHKEYEVQYASEVMKTEEYGIYDMGDFGSYNYRIPAMVTTTEGVIVTAADQRNTHWCDWGDIDIVVRTSADNGKTWSDLTDVFDVKTQPYYTTTWGSDSGVGRESAITMDPALVATTAGPTKNRVFMLVDLFPEGSSTSQGAASVSQPGSGYVTKDGKKYLALYDAAGTEYTLRGNDVYDAEGNKTAWTVLTGEAGNGFKNAGDMYEGDTYLGNIYLRSTSKGNDSAPLHPFQTSYLWLTYSDDNGKTWSAPVDLNSQIRGLTDENGVNDDTWMKFCGVGPGFGIQLQHGAHAGRIIIPIYYTTSNQGSGLGFQSSACIYSDDGGVTWTRGESPNDGRINSSGEATSSMNPTGVSQLTESQIIELSNGTLLQFMRNTGGNGKVVVARSTDGGATWSDPIDTTATDVYCQLSVLYMDHNGTDGKDRVLMSNSGGSGRTNGTLRIGEVTETEDSFSVTWTEEKVFRSGNYAYSCLTRMADGNFGLLYEHKNTIKFTSFNEAYIKDSTNIQSAAPTSVTYTVEKETEHEFSLAGDTYVFTVTMDQEVYVTGEPQFRFFLDGKARYAEYASIDDTNCVLTFRYVIQADDEGTVNYVGQKIMSDATNSVRNAQGDEASFGYTGSGLPDITYGYIGVSPDYEGYDIPVSALTATAGDQHDSASGAANVLDNNTGTNWHTSWTGTSRDNHWIQFEISGDYEVDGLRYLPRQSGGVNGIITEYEIQVSNDGTVFETVASGTWDSATTWKVVNFDAQQVKYVRLVSKDALTTTGDAAKGYVFASAAEIRLTGQEVACNHTWDEGVVETVPSCVATGTKKYTCSGCGETKTETIDMVACVTEAVAEVPATCTTTGTKAHDKCSVCGILYQNGTVVTAEDLAIAKLAHTYQKTLTKATATADGSIVEKCACGDVKSTTVIKKIGTVKLSKTTYTYTGKKQSIKLVVKDADGKVISTDNYSVKYSSRKNVGKQTVTVTFKNNYEGSKKLTFKINPKATTLKTVKAGKKAITIKWSKQRAQVTGYQVQYCTSKNFKSGVKNVWVKSAKTTSKTVKKLKAKKTYYVRVRTYKKVGKTKFYSAWSNVKKVKTK